MPGALDALPGNLPQLAKRGPARFGAALLTALAITFGLYWLMHTLIATGRGALDEGAKGRVIDFVRLKKDQQLDLKDRKPEKPPKPEAPPPEIQPKVDQTLSPAASAIDIGQVAPEEMNLKGFGLSPSDGEYLPIVKVEPVYPNRAMSRGIEGWVLLEFTVTKTGAVRDPRVVESQPPGIFDSAATKAALKFKYKPRVVDGVPVEVPGVQNLITFELED